MLQTREWERPAEEESEIQGTKQARKQRDLTSKEEPEQLQAWSSLTHGCSSGKIARGETRLLKAFRHKRLLIKDFVQIDASERIPV